MRRRLLLVSASISAAFAMLATSVPGAVGPGPLKPGHYTTGKFKPKLSFDVGRGWVAGIPEQPTFFNLIRRSGVVLGFVRVLRIVDPKRNLTSEIPASAIHAAPRDVVAWLRHHPRLRAGKPVQVTIGGVQGVRLDATVKSGYRFNTCGRPCVVLFIAAPGFLAFVPVGYTIRNYVFKINDTWLAIGILAPSGTFSRLVREGEKVVTTLRFGS